MAQSKLMIMPVGAGMRPARAIMLYRFFECLRS